MLKNIFDSFEKIEYGHSPIPFWFWNDDLNEEHLIFQINEMKDKGIDEFIIHARRGLSVEYLSETWFDRVSLTIREAKKRGMGVWIYDENNWPSGYADGRVLTLDPEAKEKYLGRVLVGEKMPDKTVPVIVKDGYQYYRGYGQRPVTYSDECYIDLLDRNSTELFIKTTHEEYYKRYKDEFGSTIKGFFVDEPGFYVNFDYFAPNEGPREDWYSITWTDRFPEEFKAQKGYDILDYLAHIWEDITPDSYKYRIDYYEVLGKLYHENFLQVLKDYCEDHGVKLMGHVHLEDFLPYHVKTQADTMKAMSHMHYAGVDRIDINTQKTAEKFASSTQHCYGMEKTMSETYALTDWELRPRDIKRWANWQYVRGVNLIVIHAFFASIAEDRVTESPPSLFYQNYYWRYFKQYTDYLKRLGYILTQGVHSCPVAVYYPITTHQELVTPFDTDASLQKDRLLVEVTTGLLDYQIDYDFLNDETLARAAYKDGKIVVGNEEYKAFIIAGVTNLHKAALKTAVELLRNGGVVMMFGEGEIKNTYPGEDKEYDALKAELLANENFVHWRGIDMHEEFCYPFDSRKLAGYLRNKNVADVELVMPDKDIKYMRRNIGDSVLYCFTNEAEIEHSFSVRIREQGNVYKLDLHTGKTAKYASEELQDRGEWKKEISATLDGYGEVIFIVSNEEIDVLDATAPALSFDNYSSCVIKNGWSAYIEESYSFPTGTVACDDSDNICENGVLADWSKWGLSEFSGVIRYENKINVSLDDDMQYVLDLGEVANCAELYVNGEHVKDMIWAPYKANITSYLRDGDNDITIRVSNILGNHIKKIAYPAGLIGDVKLIAGK